MRLLLVALGLMGGLLSPAFAADYELPILRGSDTFAPPVPPTFGIVSPTPIYRWAGVYGGVQGGYSGSAVNLGTAQSEITTLLQNNPEIGQSQGIPQWPVLGSGSSSATSASLGGFFGYNVEWEHAIILGLELNYNHVSLSTSSSGSVTRSFVDSANIPAGHNYDYTVNVSAQSSVHMTDIATFRARAGYEVGCFLPYAFAGVAIGREDTATSATLSYTAFDVPDVQTPPTPPLGSLMPLKFGPVTQAEGQNGAIAFGVAAGLGVDVALTSNVFVRGEFEYIYFGPINGIQVAVTSARVGAGLKF